MNEILLKVHVNVWIWKKNIFLNVHISFEGARKFAEGCFIELKGVPMPSYL